MPVVSVEVPAAASDRAEPVDRTTVVEPLLEFEAGGLAAGRVRAGPADPLARLEVPEWLELLPELPAECGAPESDDPPSVEAAAMPWPTLTARPRPTAAAKIPLRAACFLVRATTFRWRAACFLWRPARFLELTDSPRPVRHCVDTAT
ncbi:hypothetical protein CG716_08120 [Mycolicibacterium sphagni]|uniref:Uncharacterized protein n=1 Tax=Mycolicibacterium sphagni TaxID=1786 RepID=A0A255DU66_9MYCO|nr:hypothetical protein CG716_08120 [Mycolicibacterium sphagni]